MRNEFLIIHQKMKNNLSQLDSYGNEILDQNKIELEPREEAELTGKLEMRIENEDETSNGKLLYPSFNSR